jgi:oligoribonuclease (3'-5' exoribonuclease)
VLDFFEMERVIEELARTFAAPSATTWFKLTSNKEPTLEEYRRKVVEFINLFEDSLYSGYKDIQNSSDLLDFVKKGVKDQNKSVLSGNNKEVEKRYKYYVNY